MPCIQEFKSIGDGSPSLLYPELAKTYGEAEALRKFQQVEEAIRDGSLDGYQLRENGEPTLALVQALVKSGTIASPSAAMVNAEALAKIEELVGKSLAVAKKRLERYEDPKAAGTALAVKDKTRQELSQLVYRLENLSAEAAYVELVKFADKQLREATDFITKRFNAAETVATHGANMHAAALDEIRLQIGSYQDVFQPELALHNSVLQELIVGGPNGAIGLNQQLRELVAHLDKAQEDFLTEIISQHSNREGLSEEELREHLLGGKDVGTAARWLGGASQSTSKLLHAAHDIIEQARLRAADRHMEFRSGLSAVKDGLTKAGVKEYGFMLLLDKAGKSTGKVIQKISPAYWQERKRLRDSLAEAGDYVKGSGLTAEQKAHNLAVKAAKDANRAFTQAEVLDEDGKETDGQNHRYTEAFKKERAKFEEKRSNGKYWSWERKAGVDDQAYARYQAKYYGEPVTYNAMLSKWVDGVKVYTGEVEEREGRFTKEKATTEVVEDNWREPRYQQLLDDQSASGKAKLNFFTFYHANMDAFRAALPLEDGEHIRKGGIPPMIAAIAGRYNSKHKGYLDTLGRVVRNPITELKGLLGAADLGKKGVRVGEDGSLHKDVERKYTASFKDDVKIERLQKKLEGLDKASPTYAEDKEKLEFALAVEQNRLQASEGETDLANVLLAFGESALHYQELKQQEGTLNLLRDAVRNRDYYELDSKGEYVLENGLPIIKKNYQPALQAQLEDMLDQNYYTNKPLDEGLLENLARGTKQYVSTAFQALNGVAGIKNLLAGVTSTSIYSAGEQVGFNKKQMRFARAEVARQSVDLAADELADRLTKDHVTLRPSRSKIHGILHTLNILEHESKLNGDSAFNEIAFAGITAGELLINSHLTVAKLESIQLVGKDGKPASAYSVMHLTNGHLEIDPNYKEAWEKVRHRTILDIRNIIKHTQGNHSASDKVALEKSALGALGLQFKRFAYNFYKNRFGKQYYDEGIGASVEGHYRGVLRLGKAILQLGLRAEAYRSLSAHDKALVRQAGQELKYVLATAAVLLLAEGLKPDPDDEDKHLLYVSTNFLERVLNGMQGELTAGVDPIQAYNTAKNPMAALGIVRDAGVFGKNLLVAPFYLATGQDEKLDYQTGTLKGSSKLLHSAKAFVPGVRSITRTWEQIQTTPTQWVQ